MVEGRWSSGGAKVIFNLGIYGLQESEFRRGTHTRDVKKIGFCFNLF